MYYRKKFVESKCDPRKTWMLINEILGRKKSNLDEDLSKYFNDDKETVSENFAEHFENNVKEIIHDCNITLLNDST